MPGRSLRLSKVQATEHYAHLASDRLKKSEVCTTESIVGDILAGYPDLKIEMLGVARGGATEEGYAIVTSLVPVRVCAHLRKAT